MDLMAFALMALFAAGASVFAGADIGAAIRTAAFKSNEQRRIALAGFGTLCLSHEVWIVVTAALVNVFFARIEEDLFTRAYPWVVLLLLGWLARNVGLWLRGRVDDAIWRWLCDRALIGGARVFAASWGAVLAYASGGPWWAVAANAVALPLLLSRHGNAYLRLRLASGPRPIKPRPFLIGALLALGAAGAGLAVIATTGVLAALALIVSDDMTRQNRDLPALAYTALAVLSSLLPAVAGVAWQSSASAALAPVGVVAVCMLPLIVAAQALTWWLFRHRVSEPAYL
jgi:cytochrome d ubiquinol oxidase subunit II